MFSLCTIFFVVVTRVLIVWCTFCPHCAFFFFFFAFDIWIIIRSLFYRAVNILPNRVVGSVGQHIGEPIEEIACSWDKRFLASCAHDQLIKFWDISGLSAMRVSDYRQQKKKDGHLKALNNKAFHGVGDFFSGLLDINDANGTTEEAEDSDEEDDGDSERN